MTKENSFIVRFSQGLIKNNIVKEAEAESIIKEFNDRAKGNIIEFFLQEDLVSRENILKTLGTVYNVPFFDVKGHFFNHQWLLFFPKDFLLEKMIIPLEVDDDIMTVVMANPEDEETLEILGNYVSYNVNIYVGIQEDIIDAIREYYDEDVITSDVQDQDEDEDEEELEEDDDDSDIVDFF